jgi:predicted component of type VI protein secretion system
MPYRKVEELATSDLRFDPDESENFDLYPGRPVAHHESMDPREAPAARPRKRSPPSETPIEGLDGGQEEQDVSEESPIDFTHPPQASERAAPVTKAPSEESSNMIPIMVVVILAGVGGYLIYRSMNKSRF